MIIHLIEIFIVIVLLIFSFIYSGSEVAVFSLSEIDKLKLSYTKSKKNTLLLEYLSHPQKALVTILIGNMVANLSASIIGERLSVVFFVNNTLLYSVFIMTFLVILFGEILPKSIAASRPKFFAQKTIPLLEMTHKLFYPLVFAMTKLMKRSENFKAMNLTKEELLAAIEVSSYAGLDNVSIKVLKNLIALIDRPVTDVMIPRSEIKAVNREDPLQVIEEFIKDSTTSTLLFYSKTIDNIVGYALKFDLFELRKKDLNSRLRKPLFIPESKTLFSLLSDFKKGGNFLAVVLDEFGGLAGLVTLKDILDSIFIKDILLKNIIKKVDKNVWVVHGSTKISDVNSLLNLDLPTESNTIGGYIVNMIGKIPTHGFTWTLIDNVELTVLKSDRKQIELLELKKRDS